MFKIAALLGLLGLAAATTLMAWSGFGPILDALRIAGWSVFGVSAFHLVPLTLCVIGWQMLMPGRTRPSLLFLLYIIWIRGAVNHLLPVARIGGEIVSIRLMMKHGMRKTTAVASTIVELTLSIIAVFLFVTSGVVLLTLRFADHDLGWKLAGALVGAAPVIMLMVVVQRIGFFGLLEKIFTLALRDKWRKIAGDTRNLDHAVRLIYRRKKRVMMSAAWQVASWASASGEIWLAAEALGHPLSLLDCFIFEAMIQAASSVGFVVPGALGVQEAAFLFFGHMLGLDAPAASAMALIRRGRDVLLFLPALVTWQIAEGRWLLKKRGFS